MTPEQVLERLDKAAIDDLPIRAADAIDDATDTIKDMVAEVARLREALVMARARIEYLGVACTDPRHFEANGDVFLPKIDAALSNGERDTQ